MHTQNETISACIEKTIFIFIHAGTYLVHIKTQEHSFFHTYKYMNLPVPVHKLPIDLQTYKTYTFLYIDMYAR